MPESYASAQTEDDYFDDDDAYDNLTGDIDPEVLSLDEDDYWDDEDAAVLIPDPIEPWNRFWHGFNDGFIEYVGRPVAKGYNFITPKFVRKGIKNFFTNLRAPARAINCLLQGKGTEAGVEMSAFVLNTVWGLGGVFDLASSHETVVPRTGEDFGQTLGHWGVGEGLYLVWPFMGPSNVRDTFGRIGEWGLNVATDPFTYASSTPWALDIGFSALEGVNGLQDAIDAYDTFKSIAIDPYSAMRDGYTKLRRSAIAK